MSRRRLFIRHITLALLFSFFLAVLLACDNPTGDDGGGSGSNSGSGSGTLTVSGTDHSLTKLYIDHEGTGWAGYEINLYLLSENMSYTGTAKQGSLEGHGIDLRMELENDTVSAGTFPFDDNDGLNTFNGQAFVGPESYQEEFTSGTVQITVDDSTYTITGNDIPVQNGDTISFTYSGPVTEEF